MELSRKVASAITTYAQNNHVDVIVFEYLDNKKEQPLTLEQDHEFAQHAAEESIVLLKNEENILPLKETEQVAFIGGFVKNPRYQGGAEVPT